MLIRIALYHMSKLACYRPFSEMLISRTALLSVPLENGTNSSPHRVVRIIMNRFMEGHCNIVYMNEIIAIQLFIYNGYLYTGNGDNDRKLKNEIPL